MSHIAIPRQSSSSLTSVTKVKNPYISGLTYALVASIIGTINLTRCEQCYNLISGTGKHVTWLPVSFKSRNESSIVEVATMIYEWRVYEVMPGKMGALNDRFQKITLKLFEKHGIKVVGFWEAIVGTSNVLYYMLAYENMAHREKVWNAFMADSEWIKARQETEKDGPIVQRVVNTLLRPTSYSPME